MAENGELMLCSLEYNVTFPTGRTLTESVNFQKGFGTITGSNEAGKSFLLEMVRWLLFGTGALRGVSDDYRKLSGTLTFTVRGETFLVRRTISSATLFKNGVEVAVGTRPVNNKIVQILGFGLDVFDVTNVANQGDLERLGAMRPTERKRMVDSVIGLGVIEDLARSANDEANTLNRLADDLSLNLVEPIAPTQPDNYQPSAVISAQLGELIIMKSELDRLEGWLSVADISKPTKPNCEVEIPSADLLDMAEQQAATQTKLNEYKKFLSAVPDPSPYSDAQLLDYQSDWLGFHAYVDAQRFLASYNNPIQYSIDELNEFIDMDKKLTVWEEIQHLERRIQQLKSGEQHTCPECSHSWYDQQSAIDQLETQLAELKVKPYGSEKPPISMRMVHTLLKEHEEKEQRRVEIELALRVPSVPQPPLTEAEIRTHLDRNAKAGAKDELEGHIQRLSKQLEGQPDFRQLWLTRQKFELALEDYEKALLEYMERQSEIETKKSRVTYLKVATEALPELDAAYGAAVLYEAQQAEYEQRFETYRQAMDRVNELRAQSEDWKKAKLALTNLRALVKQHLIPSLNKVASSLLLQMTGGQRQKIEVDDDFNILVDDQPINTLSGSGKAIANLALRLGLGQVLTNNVLSVFIGDEIDGSMDKDRAENTSRTLQNLKNRISQILLITHKYPSADYYISLGNNNEYQIT